MAKNKIVKAWALIDASSNLYSASGELFVSLTKNAAMRDKKLGRKITQIEITLLPLKTKKK
jgi:hypothetical protein